MNIFLNILFLFLFVFTLIIFHLPNIKDGRFLTHKFILFVSVFCFQFVLLILSKIANKCKIDIIEIFNDSLMTSVFAILGYSIYNDLIYSNKIMNNPQCGNHGNYLLATVLIISFIAIWKVIRLSINRDYQRCIK